MADESWRQREWLDYKRRVHERRSQTREAAIAAGGGALDAGAVEARNPLVYLVPFFLLSLAGLGYLLAVRGGGFGQGSLTVVKVKGRVHATDGMKDWRLGPGDRVQPGETVVCDKDGGVELKSADPDTRLLVFEGGRFVLKTLREVGERKFLLEGASLAGEVMLDFRSESAIWGVDVKAPTGVRFLSQKTIMFKVRTRDADSRLVVGDGKVMALGPGGTKQFVRADQRMTSTDGSPVQKPEGVNVLSERWNL